MSDQSVLWPILELRKTETKKPGYTVSGWDPELDHDWSAEQKLQWHASVVSHNLHIEVALVTGTLRRRPIVSEMEERYSEQDEWEVVPDHYTFCLLKDGERRQTLFSATGFHAAWTALNAFESGYSHGYDRRNFRKGGLN